jgi:hypothetical protein
MQLSKKKIHVYKSTNTTPKSYIIKMIVTVKITFNFFLQVFIDLNVTLIKEDKT